ncbi:hypothetical protein BN2537_3855 [Streptomyces venezuelae]|nr:hypothetical protein BN2537_3855 [Streptomyces venezuelae]
MHVPYLLSARGHRERHPEPFIRRSGRFRRSRRRFGCPSAGAAGRRAAGRLRRR